MQIRLTKGRLLDDEGRLLQSGYSTFPARRYDRKYIKASKWRIKEWDYYIVSNGRYSLALTVSDIGYLGLMSASFIDLTIPSAKTMSKITPFPFGKYNFPCSYEDGDVKYDSKKVKISFANSKGVRTLDCVYEKWNGDETLKAHIKLTNPPRDAMVIATPFKENEKAFYYNAKVNCMTAEGYVEIGEKRYEFSPADSLGTLDWGRGVWTYENTWYWGSMQWRNPDGSTVGFNLGYGFGDTSQASENMFFVNGIAHKLGRVVFDIPQKDGKDDYMREWTIKDDEDRLFVRFRPFVDRFDAVNALLVSTCQYQVFGEFSGFVRLDNGEVLDFSGCRGFAEKVINKW